MKVVSTGTVTWTSCNDLLKDFYLTKFLWREKKKLKNLDFSLGGEKQQQKRKIDEDFFPLNFPLSAPLLGGKFFSSLSEKKNCRVSDEIFSPNSRRTHNRIEI